MLRMVIVSRPGIVALGSSQLPLATPHLWTGMRAALRDEFTDIYVVNLLGDAMKSDKERAKEGQVTVAIEIRDKIRGSQGHRLAQRRVDHHSGSQPRRSTLRSLRVLHYADCPRVLEAGCRSLTWLAELGDVTSDQFTIRVDVNDCTRLDQPH